MHKFFMYEAFFPAFFWLSFVVMALYGAVYAVFRYGWVGKSQEGVPLLSNLSPATLRYAWLGGYDLDCLLAAVMNAVVQRAYHVEWHENGLAARLLSKELFEQLQEPERAALSYSNGAPVHSLFIARKHTRFTDRAERQLLRVLSEQCKQLVVPRMYFLYGGFALSIFLFTVSTLAAYPNHLFVNVLYGVFIAIITFFVFLFHYIVSNIQQREGLLFTAFFILAISFPLYGILMFPFGFLSPFFILYIFINLAGFAFLPTHTLEGLRWQKRIIFYKKELENTFKQDKESLTVLDIPYLIGLSIDFGKEEYFSQLLSYREVMSSRSQWST